MYMFNYQDTYPLDVLLRLFLASSPKFFKIILKTSFGSSSRLETVADTCHKIKFKFCTLCFKRKEVSFENAKKQLD